MEFLFFIVSETTGFTGGGIPRKALASSIERSELLTNKTAS